MLFCQHIQEVKKDGLELGLLDLIGDIIWLNAATFSSLWFLSVCPLARPDSSLGWDISASEVFSFSGSDMKNYYSRKEPYKCLFRNLWIKTNYSCVLFHPRLHSLLWSKVDWSLILDSFGKTSLTQKIFTLSSYLLSCFTECSQKASIFTNRRCVAHNCFISR